MTPPREPYSIIKCKRVAGVNIASSARNWSAMRRFATTSQRWLESVKGEVRGTGGRRNEKSPTGLDRASEIVGQTEREVLNERMWSVFERDRERLMWFTVPNRLTLCFFNTSPSLPLLPHTPIHRTSPSHRRLIRIWSFFPNFSSFSVLRIFSVFI